MMPSPYHLGLPMWSNRDWVGSLFPSEANSKNFLHHYASVFNTVEGNTTFYALPSEATVASWQQQVHPGFRFSFKLPKDVTHQGRLDHGQALQQFFKRLSPLSESLGPFMIQLPASFGPSYLDNLSVFLRSLSTDYHYAVEVRHPDFFGKGDAERRLNALLMEMSVNRVCFDSRALFSQVATGPAERDAQAKKPRLPVHAIATGQQPMVRFIGTADASYNESYYRPWLKKIADWVSEGRDPYIFIHTPSNRQAPQQADVFHRQLSMLPHWQPLALAKSCEQLSIF